MNILEKKEIFGFLYGKQYKAQNPIQNRESISQADDGGSCPHEPTLGNPPHGESPSVKPMLRGAGVNDGDNSAKQTEVTCMSLNTQQGRSISA